jgi:hypothetical protein
MAVYANALREPGATKESVQSSVSGFVNSGYKPESIQRYTPSYNPVNPDGTIHRTYVPEGNYMQQELKNINLGAAGGGDLTGSTGEYALYRQLPKDEHGKQRYNRDVNTGEMTSYMLFGGGGRAALQSGTVGFAAATKAVYAEGRVGQGEFKTPDVMSVGAYNSKVTAEQIKTAVKEETAGSLLSRLGAEAYGGVVTLQDKRVLGNITYEDVSNRAAWNLASYVNPTDVNKSKAELPGVNIPWGITADYPAFFPITTEGAQKTAVPVKSFEAYLSGDMWNYKAPSTPSLDGGVAATTGNNAQVAASMDAMGYPAVSTPTPLSGITFTSISKTNNIPAVAGTLYGEKTDGLSFGGGADFAGGTPFGGGVQLPKGLGALRGGMTSQPVGYTNAGNTVPDVNIIDVGKGFVNAGIFFGGAASSLFTNIVNATKNGTTPSQVTGSSGLNVPPPNALSLTGAMVSKPTYYPSGTPAPESNLNFTNLFNYNFDTML